MEKNEKGHVIATCRNPNGAMGLLDLKNKFPERLDILQLDLTIESSIEVNESIVIPTSCFYLNQKKIHLFSMLIISLTLLWFPHNA